jgi:hypothetical protein
MSVVNHRSVCFPPHFVAFLGFKDFEDLFGLGFGGIDHGCAEVWVALANLFCVVDVEEGWIGRHVNVAAQPRVKSKSTFSLFRSFLRDFTV